MSLNVIAVTYSNTHKRLFCRYPYIEEAIARFTRLSDESGFFFVSLNHVLHVQKICFGYGSGYYFKNAFTEHIHTLQTSRF